MTPMLPWPAPKPPGSVNGLGWRGLISSDSRIAVSTPSTNISPCPCRRSCCIVSAYIDWLRTEAGHRGDRVQACPESGAGELERGRSPGIKKAALAADDEMLFS